MKSVAVLMFAALFLAGSGFKSTSSGVWVIDAESRLAIRGSTNVNDFICRIDYCSGTDTLRYVENEEKKEFRFTRSKMIISVYSFSCGAKPLSKDFWKTLNAADHPYLTINFVSLDNVYFKDRTRVKGVVDITLSGKTARYDVCYDVILKANGNIHLIGSQSVKFADFQLKTPERLNGLIKVNEVLNVDFNLVVREL